MLLGLGARVRACQRSRVHAPSYLVLDIETVVDPELPQADGGQRSGLPPPPFHQIVCIGVLWMDQLYRVRRLGIIGSGRSEPDALMDFSRFVGERRPDLVTYNGRGFDMPVIAARCLRHGVPFAHYYGSRDVRYRFSAAGHLDLMDFLTDFGASRASRLDVIARSMGMPGKVGIDGKDVGPMVHAGRIAEVQAYCLCDVAQTTGVFLRVQLVRGQLDRDGYLAAMKDLIDHIDSDERLRPVADAMDRDRLLLREGQAPPAAHPAPAQAAPAAQAPPAHATPAQAPAPAQDPAPKSSGGGEGAAAPGEDGGDEGSAAEAAAASDMRGGAIEGGATGKAPAEGANDTTEGAAKAIAALSDAWQEKAELNEGGEGSGGERVVGGEPQTPR